MVLLREFIERLEAEGELKYISHANWDIEIGAITEKVAEEKKHKALLFDEIEGYKKGFRVVTNLLSTEGRFKLALGLDKNLSKDEVVRWFREKLRTFKNSNSLSYVSISENFGHLDEQNDINLFKFPAPKWHEFDGGRYIGTGCCVITQDPEESWINIGTYRVMIHNTHTLSFYVSPGKHASIMRQKYWNNQEDCPVVVCFGQDPLLWIVSTLPLPWGISEFDFVSHLSGKTIDVIKGKYTGLPIPASAEIAVEGFSPPPKIESRDEGPFGEWSGYYGSKVRSEPVINIKAVYYKDNPIIHGQPPLKYPQTAWHPIPIHSVPFLWDALEKNVQGIKKVWIHGPGNRMFVVISVEQQYLGHAKQVALLASSLYQGGAGTGRWVVVVDEDIDPSNFEEVLWAICTRCDPETSIEIIRGYLSSSLDTTIPAEKRKVNNFTTSKVIIDACRPFHWDDFPLVHEANKELKEALMKKYEL